MIGTFNLPMSSDTLTGFVTEWLASGDTTARTITLPLVNGYSYDAVVDWGDSTTSTIKSYNDANRIHTYSTNGTYEVNIVGTCEGWSFNNGGDKLKIRKVINFGGEHFNGFKYLLNGFFGCTNLTSIGSNPIKPSGTGVVSNGFVNCFRLCTSLNSLPNNLFRYNALPNDFGNTFDGCTSLASLPTDLFRYNTNTTWFYETFRGCTSLASLPTDLFRYNTNTTWFIGTFIGCTALSGVPTDLFRYNTAVTNFQQVFDGCSNTNFKTLPVDLFRYNTGVTNFSYAFRACSNLSALTSDLFQYNTAVTTFIEAFKNCGSLTSLPTDLFRYNTAVTNFQQCFDMEGVTSQLATIPDDLLRYNTLVTNFSYMFRHCIKLQQKANIFGTDTANRFLNKSVNFTECFNRNSFTGTQGVAPDLWNFSFGTGTPTKTSCWAGAGNSLTSLSNYASIPADWK